MSQRGSAYSNSESLFHCKLCALIFYDLEQAFHKDRFIESTCLKPVTRCSTLFENTRAIKKARIANNPYRTIMPWIIKILNCLQSFYPTCKLRVALERQWNPKEPDNQVPSIVIWRRATTVDSWDYFSWCLFEYYCNGAKRG